MRFAFYRGRGGGWVSRFIGWAIRWRTNGQFSHVEAVFPAQNAEGKSLCFSSSEMDGGTRFTWIGVENDPNWVILYAPMLDLEKCLEWCKSQQGKPYDFRAIARFALGIPMPPNGIHFCSEACVEMAKAQGFMPDVDAATVSPQDFYYLLAMARNEDK